MGVKKKESSNEITFTLKKDMIFPIIFIILIGVMTFFWGKNLYDSMNYQRQAGQMKAQEEASPMSTYTNSQLNLVMSYPSEFIPNNIDQDVMSALMSVLTSTDKTFTLYNIKVPTEIAPVVFMKAEEGTAYSEFMSLTIRGSNVNLSELSTLKGLLMSEFKELVQSDDVESIAELDNTASGQFITLRIKATISEELSIYYTQVGTVVGKNFVSLIHATSHQDNDQISNMKYMLGNLTVLNDNNAGVQLDNHKDLVGTALLAPRELTAEMKSAVSEVIAEAQEQEIIDEAIEKLEGEGKVYTEEEAQKGIVHDDTTANGVEDEHDHNSDVNNSSGGE